MQINISTRHGHLSAATQELITDKVEKVQKFHDRINAIGVTCDLEHRDHPHVEVLVSAEHAGEFVATADAENLVAALDGALHKIEQQLRKHKEKTTGHRASGIKHLPLDAAADADND